MDYNILFWGYSSSGLPKVDFWAVAEAVAVDGKTSATVAEAVAEGEGFNFQNLSKVMLGINLQRILAHISNQALFSITFYF